MKLNTPPMLRSRRDWFYVLRSLKKAGVSYQEVARKCSRHVGCVQNWAEGGDPKDADARIVLALFARYCPQEFEEHMKLYEVRPAAVHPDDKTSA